MNAPGVGVTEERWRPLGPGDPTLRADSWPGGDCEGEPKVVRKGLGLGVLLWLLVPDGFFTALLNMLVLGVRGVWDEVDEDAEDGGRGIVE